MGKLMLQLSLCVFSCLFMAQAKPAYDDPSKMPGCAGQPADVIFVLDSSSKVHPTHFEKVKTFMIKMISKYQIADDRTRIGLITFGGHVQTIHGLGNIQEAMTVRTVAENISQLKGETLTHQGILKALEIFKNHERESARKILIVLTSKSDYAPLTETVSDMTHSAGVTVFAIGIGSIRDTRELRKIASKEEYILDVDDFDRLEKFNTELAMKTCNIQSDYPYDNSILPKGKRRHNRLWKDGKPMKACGGRPADIVFCLDGSSSIWGPDFNRQLEFVEDMTRVFQVGPNMTKIGVVTFGDNPTMEFNLNDYQYESDVLAAIQYVHQITGGTNTADALKTMRKEYFIPGNSRGDVIKMAIVITDGKSNDRSATIEQAKLLKAEGVHVFAVGVGDRCDEKELRMIASEPASDYVHRASNYAALKTIRRILALKACKVTLPPTTTTTPAPITACGEQRPADIVFSMPPDASAAQAAEILSMIGDCTDELDMGDNAVRIGMVPKECISIPGIKLSGDIDGSSIMGDFEKEYAAAHTSKVLKYMRKKSFTEEFGAREEAQKFGILIVDAASTDFKQTAIEATKARKSGIEMFVIAVGDNIPNHELTSIASGPLDDHIFRVNSYDELPQTVKKLVKLINEACVDHVPEIEIYGPDIKEEEEIEEEEKDYDYGHYYDYPLYGTS